MKLFTIGFTKKTAAQFFGLLQEAGVRSVLDTRLNNRSQLSGFTKADDLSYFLGAIASIGYQYAPEMAPTQALLDGYKKFNIGWDAYEREYLSLLRQRSVHEIVSRTLLDNACLLCSEHQPKHCHRRLAAEYLQRHFPDLEVVHLT